MCGPKNTKEIEDQAQKHELQEHDQDAEGEFYMSLAEAAFKERVAKLIKVQLFQKTQDGSWNGGKMGWAHWQTKESYINLWYKPIQEEKEPATQEKAVQTDGSAGAHRWMLTVLSRPIMFSKSYIMSVASALALPTEEFRSASCSFHGGGTSRRPHNC